MKYYIKKPSLVDSNITVYYIGNKTWSDDESQKIVFTNESEALTIMENSDGRNGGWKDATIVSE